MAAVFITAPRHPADFDAMWRFNHTVFATELAMRECCPEARLVDKFHGKNFYRIAIDPTDSMIIGMISAHHQAPYSAVEHFGETVADGIADGLLGEIRLYAVAPAWRKTSVAARLGLAVLEALDAAGVTEVVISGISEQQEFYKHLGFQVVGKPVSCGHTLLYPMRSPLPRLLNRCLRVRNFLER